MSESARAAKAAVYVFAALIVATFAAFFVAQRLKHGPTLIQQLRVYPVFSPNRDGRLDRARVNFLLEKSDQITVDVVNNLGDPVKRLVDDEEQPAYKQLYLKWDGRTDDGAVAPDGRYRMRVALRRQGRRVTIPRAFTKDTAAPLVKVLSIGPGKGPGPELLPGKQPVTVRFVAPARNKRVSVWRTYPGPPERKLGPVKLADDAHTWQWDGRLAGRPVRPGSYVVVVEAQDGAQNIGSSVPLTGADRHPAQPLGRRLPSRGGITVRYLGVEAPPAPLPAGRVAKIAFDARGEPVSWSLRRAGGAPKPIRRSGGTVAVPPMKVPIPSGESGLYVLTVRSATHVQRVPLIARSSAAHRVLVVMPAFTWQGRNPLDDDGDGLVNTLTRGVSVMVGLREQRIMVGDGTGMPLGVTTHEAPVLAYLDRRHHRYDITTDAALDAGIGPRDLSAYRGILLPGDTRWLPARLGARLRRYVRGGGTLVSLGTQSLRALIDVSRGGRALHPTALAEEDVFGATLRPPERGRATITALTPDKAKLFEGGTGLFTGYRGFEETGPLAPGTSLLSSAVAADRPVIIAVRFGKGVVARTGLPQLPVRLSRDANTAQLMERLWTLLSR